MLILLALRWSSVRRPWYWHLIRCRSQWTTLVQGWEQIPSWLSPQIGQSMFHMWVNTFLQLSIGTNEDITFSKLVFHNLCNMICISHFPDDAFAFLFNGPAGQSISAKMDMWGSWLGDSECWSDGLHVDRGNPKYPRWVIHSLVFSFNGPWSYSFINHVFIGSWSKGSESLYLAIWGIFLGKPQHIGWQTESMKCMTHVKICAPQQI